MSIGCWKFIVAQLAKEAKHKGAAILTRIPAVNQERCATCKSFDFISLEEGECQPSGCRRSSQQKACILRRQKFMVPMTTKAAYFMRLAEKVGP